MWDVLTTFQGQLKVVGMGAVQGVDLTALIPLLKEFEVDTGAFLHLLPYVEQGILEGHREHQERNRQDKAKE